MSADAISSIIENNKARMEMLEERKEEYDQAISDAKEQKHSIWLQMRSFLNRCGTTNPMHLNSEQRAMYDAMVAGYYGAKHSYNKAISGYLSTNNSLFDLVLENGRFEQSQMIYNNAILDNQSMC